MIKNNITIKRDKSEYGDFQTPLELARKICCWLKNQGVKPQVLIEPTCGCGNFILAALETFFSIKHVYGIEIYKPYIIETENKIDSFRNRQNIDIKIIQDDVFHFQFNEIAKRHKTQSILVLGNPPWVTNSGLSAKESDNLPTKSNLKNVSGIEAITGKGNFDIGESITFSMLKTFAESNGCFAFLAKNIVIKNVIQSQQQFSFPISDLRQIDIDAKKEFNANVDAGLFFARFNESPATNCCVAESFDQPAIRSFGWMQKKFVADIERYKKCTEFDRVSPEIWRQGLKHDCAAVMELTKNNNCYKNNLNETVTIERDLVYPLLKSSDLNGRQVITKTNKNVIVTQTVVGQNTDYIEMNFPQTFNYLDKHKETFYKRKSVIYKNKPSFSIFGIGDYSFKPFKVAISGLYKQTQFSLVLPIDNKPVMFDDTCYFLGFDSLEEATCVVYCLNQPEIQNLLQSIVFWNAKRVITKDILMRLDYFPILRRIEINKMLEYAEKQQLQLTKNIFLKNSNFIFGHQRQEFLW
ncbi:MAG: hypothetical protein LBH59_00880 [Planctomycetaceae bacterium]|jgi:predicted RNA methylase|nr:hypothetical protein [Planctomycetaceae bacterium]